MPEANSIFVSYRRSDSNDLTGRIYDRLAAHFGPEVVFRDVQSIPFGVDFRTHLQQQIGRCQVVVAVIGTTWLTVEDAEGNRRLNNPNDWVRAELETALNRDIPLIPVLMEGVRLPSAEDLPGDLKGLAYRNKAHARTDPDFHPDMDRLIRRLEEIVGAPASPQPLVAPSTPARPGPAQRSASPISRRRAIQILGFSGGGIGAVLLGRAILQSSPDALDPAPPEENPPTPSPPRTTPPDPNPPETPATPALTAADFTPFDFEVVKVNNTGEVVSREPKQAQAFREAIGATFLDLVAVPGGTFTMGSPDSELERTSAEGPQRDVNVPAFLMGKYPVTQAQWKAVAALPKIGRDLNADLAYFKGDNLPVEQVSWDAAVEFCQRLSKQTGRAYRLPSEAEWEYACRAGTTTPFHFGETITTDLANYNGSSTYGSGPKGEFRQKTTEVGSFKIANAFGLYDMHGNVWDWCADHWHESYEGAPTDGSAWTTGGDDSLRVLRGGSWGSNPWLCRSARRNRNARDIQYNLIGFRLVCASSWAL